MTTNIIKIPMTEGTKVELEDCFIDIPNMDARKYVFDNLKMACQDAKRSIRNEVTIVNQKQDNGQITQVEYSLKGVKLDDYPLDSNPAWLPEGMSKEGLSPVELKLGDATMNYVRKFGQLVLIRHEQFNEAEEKFYETTEKKMIDAQTPEASLKEWRKHQDTIRKDRMKAVPNCLEKAVFVSIWPLIQQKLEQSDSLVFDKEYNEQYPPEGAKQATQ